MNVLTKNESMFIANTTDGGSKVPSLHAVILNADKASPVGALVITAQQRESGKPELRLSVYPRSGRFDVVASEGNRGLTKLKEMLVQKGLLSQEEEARPEREGRFAIETSSSRNVYQQFCGDNSIYYPSSVVALASSSDREHQPRDVILQLQRSNLITSQMAAAAHSLCELLMHPDIKLLKEGTVVQAQLLRDHIPEAGVQSARGQG